MSSLHILPLSTLNHTQWSSIGSALLNSQSVKNEHATFFETRNSSLTLILLSVLIIVLFSLARIGKREASLPPGEPVVFRLVIFVPKGITDVYQGPPTLPLLGNLHQTFRGEFHIHLTKWAEQYGGIISLKTGNHTTIVLTDRLAIKDLLDKRGANYADRPDSYVLNELVSGGHHLLPMRYGRRWRKLRRVLTQELSNTRCDQVHLPLQHAEATQLLDDIINTSSESRLHLKRFGTSIMTSTVFGIRLPHSRVKFLTKLETLFHQLVSATIVGAYPPVDYIPLLKYLPDFCWSNWRSNAVDIGVKLASFYDDLIQKVKSRQQAGIVLDSSLDRILANQAQYDVTDHEIIYLCGTLLEGGSETSSATIEVFINAMFNNPDVVHKAQQQIDSHFDENDMPTWSDYENLPYVAQIIKETMRWKTISPIAFPHATTTEDVYRGYRIPARATIIINAYGLHRDPQHFPEPDRFLPERFDGLTAPADELANSADPNTGRDHYGYGAGRRICPGIHLAERNLFIAISRLLWAFDFTKISPDQTDDEDAVLLDDTRGRLTLRSASRGVTIGRELARAKDEVFDKFDTEI